jgi:uncharacterized protein YkwD
LKPKKIKMILKIKSGLSQKQKLMLIGFVLVMTLSLAISYIINQSTKPSQAKSLNQTTLVSSILSQSSSSSKSLTSLSSSIRSSSSSLVSSSSSSEIPKPVEEKPKEEIKPEPIIERITKIDPPVIVEPEPVKPIQVKTQEPVYIPPKPKIEEVLQPKIENPVLEPKPIVVEQSVIEPPKPNIFFSSNTCNQSMINELLSLVNNHRLANDVGTLRLATDLNNVACSHAQWMNQTGNFSHTGKDGTNPYQRCERAGTVCWAENVAYDTETSAYNMFEMYKNSPGHNKNMLNPDYIEVGLAFDGIYNAQEFR